VTGGSLVVQESHHPHAPQLLSGPGTHRMLREEVSEEALAEGVQTAGEQAQALQRDCTVTMAATIMHAGAGKRTVARRGNVMDV
jgi:hypothetical protein